MSNDNNGWDEYRIFITETLKRIEDGQKESTEAINAMRNKIVVIETKIAFIGGVAGIIGALAVTIVKKIIGWQ